MVWRWSTNAASNSNSDSTINWAEGQPPSSINDSSRAEMARVAQWRSDISGGTGTTGSGSAYALTSNQSFDTLAHLDAAMIAFTPHTVNTGTCTLSVDGLTAKPIRLAPGIDLPNGTLVAGTPYVVTYFNTAGEFILQGGANAYGIPLGGGMDYWLDTTPSSAFVFPVGQAISRTVYSALFARMGTIFGSGDGSTTFNLPDKRGKVSAGYDGMGGSLAGRLSLGLYSSMGSQTHTLTTDQIPPATPTGSVDISHEHNQGGKLVGIQSGNGISFNIARLDVASDNTTGITNGLTTSAIKTLSMDPLPYTSGAHNNVQPTISCNYILRVI